MLLDLCVWIVRVVRVDIITHDKIFKNNYQNLEFFFLFLKKKIITIFCKKGKEEGVCHNIVQKMLNIS
jgi:hypothetical protein